MSDYPFGLTTLYGLQLFEDPNMPDGCELRQVRFPRSKKRRIRKKWSKRDRNWKRVPVGEPPIYHIGNNIVAHPRVMRLVVDALSGSR